MKSIQLQDKNLIDQNLTPLKAIRKKCLWCMSDQSNEIRLCTCEGTCLLYPYRFGKRPDIKPALTPIKAIKAKCYDCSGFNKAEQRRCEFKDCVLWPYRLGHNPKLKGKVHKGSFTKKTTLQEPVLV